VDGLSMGMTFNEALIIGQQISAPAKEEVFSFLDKRGFLVRIFG